MRESKGKEFLAGCIDVAPRLWLAGHGAAGCPSWQGALWQSVRLTRFSNTRALYKKAQKLLREKLISVVLPTDVVRNLGHRDACDYQENRACRNLRRSLEVRSPSSSKSGSSGGSYQSMISAKPLACR